MIRKMLAKINTTTWCRIAAVIILLFASKNMFLSVINWENVKGWEAYFIAQAIAEGEGYSFPSTNRWLFDSAVDGKYHPTAWVDPFYTYCLAGSIWLFGGYHQLAAAFFNLLLYIAVFILTYHLAERLISSRAAVLVVVLLAISKFSTLRSLMNNTFLAASLILLSAVVLVNFFERPCFRRAAVLGLVLGLTVLASPSAQFFIPVAAISIIFWGRKNYKIAVSHSIIVFIIAVVIMAPWTIRNYLVFDEFVLVRNGAGQIVFVGVVAAAGTVMPEKIASSTKPIWQAKTPRMAVFNIYRNEDKLISLQQFQLEYAKEVGPNLWRHMNEAQRDKWFFKETREFVFANPIISIQLAIAKIEVFVRAMGWFGTGIILWAIVGVLITLKNPAVSTIAFWVGSYVGPFLLVICFYNRYRAPIEPLLTLLAVFAIYWIINRSKLGVYFTSREIISDS